MPFTIALVGRPNVGKSTLYNRLTRTRHALVDDTPGVTRDWREGEGWLADLFFHVRDTAGLEESGDETSIESRMVAQTEAGLSGADLAVMIIDGKAGLNAQDEHFARWMRKKNIPVVLVVNKAEGRDTDAAYGEAFRLGFGEPVAVSAEHGLGMAELQEAILPHWKAWKERQPADPVSEDAGDDDGKAIKLVILGRPNAGKSTLLNVILGEERVMTGPEAGITRDAIAVPFDYKGKRLELVDTAGMRRRSKVAGRLEQLSVHDARRSLKFAHVGILLLDATIALEKQDLHVANQVIEEGRALVIGLNKWDTVPRDKREALMKWLDLRLEETLPQVRGVEVVTLSALEKKGWQDLLDAALRAYGVWNRRITTAKLNQWLKETVDQHPPPIIANRRLKFRYMTQVKSRPPRFALFVNIEEVPDSYLRYLANSFRDVFSMPGVPLRFLLRKQDNPYDRKDRK